LTGPNAVKPGIWKALKSFLLELLVYAVLVTGYYLLVLHFLGNGLKEIYQHDRRYYAGLALALIVGQGFLLEVLTRVLLSCILPRTEE
jgi:hypothetical protein